jgi:hypothetical protein
VAYCWQGSDELLTVLELMARQSSWFLTLAPEIVTPVLSPMSKASVLWPKLWVSPAELSMVIRSRVRPLAPSMEKVCTGVFFMLRSVMEEVVSEWA